MNNNFFFQKRLSEENPTITYSNRYRDQFTFTYISEDVVGMSGDFSYVRVIPFEKNPSEERLFETDLSTLQSAYNSYLQDASNLVLDAHFILTFDEFKNRWEHFVDSSAVSQLYKSFRERYTPPTLPASIPTASRKYIMIDPPGGPYLESGQELYEGKIIKYFSNPEIPGIDQSPSSKLRLFYIHLEDKKLSSYSEED